jgi:transcriptional regulator with XRE-family HTH domain
MNVFCLVFVRAGAYQLKRSRVFMTIGEKLRDLRFKEEKTMKEFSEILGVSLNTVYRWEHNLTKPRYGVLTRLSLFFNVPMEWLLSKHTADDSEPFFQSTGEVTGTDDVVYQELLFYFKKLSNNDKYKVLGYVERLCIDGLCKRPVNDVAKDIQYA